MSPLTLALLTHAAAFIAGAAWWSWRGSRP